MLGNFTFHNPTKIYFGENSLENLSKELGNYGEKVMLVYGGGSIRKNGIYNAVLAELHKAGKQTVGCHAKSYNRKGNGRRGTRKERGGGFDSCCWWRIRLRLL